MDSRWPNQWDSCRLELDPMTLRPEKGGSQSSFLKLEHERFVRKGAGQKRGARSPHSSSWNTQDLLGRGRARKGGLAVLTHKEKAM